MNCKQVDAYGGKRDLVSDSGKTNTHNVLGRNFVISSEVILSFLN